MGPRGLSRHSSMLSLWACSLTARCGQWRRPAGLTNSSISGLPIIPASCRHRAPAAQLAAALTPREPASPLTRPLSVSHSPLPFPLCSRQVVMGLLGCPNIPQRGFPLDAGVEVGLSEEGGTLLVAAKASAARWSWFPLSLAPAPIRLPRPPRLRPSAHRLKRCGPHPVRPSPGVRRLPGASQGAGHGRRSEGFSRHG